MYEKFPRGNHILKKGENRRSERIRHRNHLTKTLNHKNFSLLNHTSQKERRENHRVLRGKETMGKYRIFKVGICDDDIVSIDKITIQDYIVTDTLSLFRQSGRPYVKNLWLDETIFGGRCCSRTRGCLHEKTKMVQNIKVD